MGKIMVLNFSDSEEYIVEKIKSVIENENNIEYREIENKSILTYQDLKIHLKEQTVYKAGQIVSLSHKEFLTLCLFVEYPGRVYTKEQIYESVYKNECVIDIENSIYCLIYSLRKKLEIDSKRPKYIQTVRNVGYKFITLEE